MSPSTIDQLLEDARRDLRRVAPHEAHAAMARDGVLVDIRTESQREREGVVPGTVFIPRNVLEWRCDPASRWRDPRVSDPSVAVIVMCDAGYQSSLAAATLQSLGHARATDVIGGFQGWRAAGLPVEPLAVNGG